MRKHATSALFVLGSLTAQTTWIVDGQNPTALPSLAAAVAAASDGDTIRIRHATEVPASTVVITKSLRILGDCPTTPGNTAALWLFVAGIQIQLAAGKELVLTNCKLTSFLSPNPIGNRITISNSDGRVLLDNLPDSYCSLVVQNSRHVVLSRVAVTMPAPMSIDHSTVACDRCSLIGLPGNYETSAPSVMAMDLQHATLHCVDTIVQGGNAGYHLGMWVAWMPGSRAMRAVDSIVTMHGAGAVVAAGTLWTQPPIDATQSTFEFRPGFAPAIAGTATVTTLDTPTVDVANFATGTTATLTLQAPIGSLSALVFGAPGDHTPVPGALGELWIDLQRFCVPVAGVMGSGGAPWNVTVPSSPVLSGQPWMWQGVTLQPSGLLFGPPGLGVLR